MGRGHAAGVTVALVLLMSDRRETFQTEAYGASRKVGDAIAAAVTGVLATPCSPYEARGDIVQRLDQVTVLVIGRPEGRCAPGAGRIYYSAGFELPPGEYTVRVIHHWDDAERPAETVLQRTVTVR